MPLAADAAAGFLLLAFAPLELRLMRVEITRRGPSAPGAPAPPPTARLTTLRDLSIIGLGSPLQVRLAGRLGCWAGGAGASKERRQLRGHDSNARHAQSAMC